MLGKDKFTPTERSAIMARVRSWNTTPERMVRSTLHKLGYRYRLHDNRLPGKPDLSFPSRRIALFVNGCFWHRHPNCKRASTRSRVKIIGSANFREPRRETIGTGL